MRAILTTDLEVARFAAFAEMAWMERRPELGVLCQAAREAGDRITADVVQSVLPGVSAAGARGVLNWCQTLTLCDKGGALTELGYEVAVTQTAPVPEQGVYGMWAAEHPLMGRRLLAIKRLSSSRDGHFADIAPVPLEPDQGVVFRSLIDPDERFLLRDLPAHHRGARALPKATAAACRLTWRLDFTAQRDRWQLSGQLDGRGGKMDNITHSPEGDGLDLWQLMSQWGEGPLSAEGRWQPSRRLLEVPLKGLSAKEQDTFKKDLTLPEVEVPGKGRYADARLEGVPIGPRSKAEAQSWAVSCLLRRLQQAPGFRSRAALRDTFIELVEGSPLHAHAPALPAHEVLQTNAALQSKTPALYWSLIAPVDLAPTPHAPDELDALVVGEASAPSPAPSQRDPLVVRVPYRSGWSMRELLDRLLAGVAPNAALLCDRFVRGEENLEALRVLVEALQSAAPAARLTVWTEEDGDNMNRIQKITGRRPIPYGQAFSGARPHDRYLLVRPSDGTGFGWQLSNSPLHARVDLPKPSPQTPLRWRDLTGTRLTPDALEPAMRQWLTGGAR